MSWPSGSPCFNSKSLLGSVFFFFSVRIFSLTQSAGHLVFSYLGYSGAVVVHLAFLSWDAVVALSPHSQKMLGSVSTWDTVVLCPPHVVQAWFPGGLSHGKRASSLREFACSPCAVVALNT